MYATLIRCYRKTHNKTVLKNAVKRGWITEEQMEEIIEIVDREEN